MNCVYSNSLQDNDWNVSSWLGAYTIASNLAGDHPAFNVDYQSYFEPYAKWIWARWPPTEALPPRLEDASSLVGLNCAFCRADRLAKRPDKADVRGKYMYTSASDTYRQIVSFLVQLTSWIFLRFLFTVLFCSLLHSSHALERMERILSVIELYNMLFSL